MTLHPISGKSYLFGLLVCMCASVCAAQTAVPVVLAPVPQLQFFDQSGRPLSFGCVFTFQSQTTTPLATYTDFTGQFQNQNPVLLNAGGSANIWLQSGQAYSLTVKSSGGTNCSLGQTLYTVDGVGGGASQLNTVVTPSGGSAAFTVQSQNQLFSLTLTGNVAGSPVSFIGVIAPALVTFQITEDGAGSHGFTWPSNVIGPASVATCANCVTTQTFIWNGLTIMPVAPSYNLNGQMFPPNRADTLTGQYLTINGQAEGAIVGYSFWGAHSSPSTTSSEILCTHKITGTLPNSATQACGTFETDLVGTVTPGTGVLVAEEGYTAVRSNGGTVADVRGYTASVNLDLAGSTTNVTDASSLFGSPCINSTGGTATITNCYSVRGAQPTAGTARNYSFFSEGSTLFANNVNIDAIDASGNVQRFTTFGADNKITLRPLADASGFHFTNQAASTTWLDMNSSGVSIPSLDLTLGKGVGADGGGFKHKRFGASCTTGTTAGNSCTTAYTWTTAFADTSYTVSCNGVNAVNGPVWDVETKTAAGFTFRVYTIVALASSYGEVDCIAVHD